MTGSCIISKMKSLRVTLFALFALAAYANAACPDLKTTKVNVAEIKKHNPKGVWHVLACKGAKINDESEGEGEAKDDPPIEGVDGKVCVSARIQVRKQNIGEGPSYQCSYVSSNPGEKHCEVVPNTGIGMITALNALGHQVPKTSRIKVVDTDNKSYAVIAKCDDGHIFSWAILGKRKHTRFDKKKAYAALGITEADVEAAKKNKIKASRITFREGECVKGKEDAEEVKVGGAGMWGGVGR